MMTGEQNFSPFFIKSRCLVASLVIEIRASFRPWSKWTKQNLVNARCINQSQNIIKQEIMTIILFVEDNLLIVKVIFALTQIMQQNMRYFGLGVYSNQRKVLQIH